MSVLLPKEQRSLWMPTLTKSYQTLKDDIEVDVVIVGAGIAGITIGYKLKQAGYRVAVLEKNLVASGTTGGTTGKVSLQHGLIYSQLIKQFGQKSAQIYVDSYSQAFSDIEATIKLEDVACDWSYEDHFLYTNSQAQLAVFQQEASDAAKLGLLASYIDRPLLLPFPTKGGIKFEKQAKFNASLYTQALAKNIHGSGSFVFEASEVKKIKKGETTIVKTNMGSVAAKSVVIATKVPPSPLLARATYVSIVYPENSYIVAGESANQLTGMYNTPDQEHYSLLPVQQGKKTYVLIGGENHLPGLGIANRHYKKLAEYARAWFNVSKIEYKWRAMDYIAYDKLPVIGELYPGSKNIYAVSGFKKWGLATSMVAAQVVLGLLAGENTPASRLFYPHRFSAPLSIPRATLEYLKR